jgi:hypothetical protein
MGAWGHRAFDNDQACDWLCDLEKVDDLSLIEAALAAVGEIKPDGEVGQDLACNALGACEVLARLSGRPGYNDTSTRSIDEWVGAHPLKPAPALLNRAVTAIDRILGDRSELRELWDEGKEPDRWYAAVKDLRSRLEPPRGNQA